jgi:hypothetical protein
MPFHQLSGPIAGSSAFTSQPLDSNLQVAVASEAHRKAEFEAAVRLEALERLTVLGRSAAQCEARAAQADLDAIDAEALIEAGREYRRQQCAILKSFYPHANILRERPRLRFRDPVAFFRFILALSVLLAAAGILLWRWL